MIATLIYNTPELVDEFKKLNATIIDVSVEPIEQVLSKLHDT